MALVGVHHSWADLWVSDRGVGVTQQHGRRYEHTLSQEIDEATTTDAWVTTVGYSGNSAIGASDIVVTVNPKLSSAQYNMEAKKRQAETSKRCSNVFSGSETDETGVEELHRLITGTPPWSTPIMVLSFDHRAPVVFDARLLATWLKERTNSDVPLLRDLQPIRPSPKKETLLEALAPRTTPSDSISMIKPETDTLDSAQVSPPEGKRVAELLRLPLITDEPFGDVTTGVTADDD